MNQSKILIISLIILIITVPLSFATIIDIPDDYATIQAGIDISTDGDTVLVQPGTYVENINFNEHNIVLGSLFLTTGDTSFITQTVVDGDSSGSVVTFMNGEDSTTIITGFTIQNGITVAGGGIACYNNSNPIIKNNAITSNVSYRGFGGGGIYAGNSSPTIEGNLIINNIAVPYSEYDGWYPGDGAGIYLLNSNSRIQSNIIKGNWVSEDCRGSGIYCYYSNPTINSCIITENINYSNDNAAVSCNNSNATITNTITWANFSQGINTYGDSELLVTYCNIQDGYSGLGNIDANPMFIDPVSNNYNMCEQSPCIDAGDTTITDPDGSRSDIGIYFETHPICNFGSIWHVSPSGDDGFGDGSPDNPFRSVQYAIDNSYFQDTIIVDNGVYYENLDLRSKSIVLASNFIYSLDENDIVNTIIDGSDMDTSAVAIGLCDEPTAIIGFTIQNGSISRPNLEGAGILCYRSDVMIKNNIIKNNDTNPNLYGTSGGGIAAVLSNAIITNNLICNNTARMGAGISIHGQLPGTMLSHNVIVENYAYDNYGGIYGTPAVINSIVRDNEPENVSSEFSISYSNIGGGCEGEGNIDIDPQFRDPDNDDFHLMAIECGDPYDSPCIDMGHPGILDTILNCDWGLGHHRSDMGAFSGGEEAVDIDESVASIPDKISISQNYPNPFNASTTIKYELPSQSHVTIEIYDIIGRKVRTLIERQQPPGYHQAIWQADDFSSGMYFYKLQAGDLIQTKKMLLLK
ncbi:MAG: T9SS type A sorting domain-containing protein [candidate division Zixibacteria bacterium]|nr:T9SS type A sorting domain-containing protein [candidate division Zixibacteria bacterium]